MLDLILPRRCPYCDSTLLPQEEGVCLRCLPLLPRVHAEHPNNDVERRLFGCFPFEHATAYCYYGQKEPFGAILRQSKFNDRPWLNEWATRLFVQELQMAADERGEEGWPYDIDVIVPVPLHPFRLLLRGYNQCAGIVKVLTEAWHIPLESGCLRKHRYTRSQIGLSNEERLQNVDGSFTVRHPERLAGKHILIVDDVLTTGSTMVAAADALLHSVPDIRLSVLTLAFSRG
ncbi:MAG: ComF family protein [Bacteroidales bacterium]|nr:ComF family protein [Bacteroidales bacterium]